MCPNMPTETYVVAAGGTGGHIFPGIAVADELTRRDKEIRVVFVGTSRGLESKLVPRAGYELLQLPIWPLNAVGLLRALKGLLLLPWSLLRAALAIRRLSPRAVLGVGGYVGGPVVLVAALFGIRTVILEPNAHPGFTNRVLRRFVDHAACAYEAAQRAFGSKGVLTGNPIRSGFGAAPPARQDSARTLLIFGGSQGSAILNRVVVEALPHLPPVETLRIVHQTGVRQHAEVQAAYEKSGRPAEVVEFLHDMVARLNSADLIVCRSGATTCAELTAAGKASVLIPFALAADDHQRTNARALADAGAAVMIEEEALSGPMLARTVTDLVTQPSRLDKMARAAHRLARPDAASRVADLLQGILRV